MNQREPKPNDLVRFRMNQKKIVIFCQASLDVPYVLWLYETKKQNFFFSIYVVGVLSAYRFLKSLGMAYSEITFVPVLKLRNPINILKTRLNLEKIRIKKLKNIHEAEIYFFSNYYDFSTMYFLKHLKQNNKICFIDHYLLPFTSNSKASIYEKCRQLAIFLASNMKCDFILLQRIPIFNASSYEKIKVDIWLDQVWIEHYMIKLGDLDSKIALILDSNEQECGEYKNFELIVKVMVDILLKYNYSIIVKPHPRVGYSKIYNSLSVRIADSWIPSQLFDPSGIRAVIGIGSTGLTRHYPAPHKKINSISLLKILDSYDKDLTQEEINYLNTMSNSRVLFPNNMEEFGEIVDISNN